MDPRKRAWLWAGLGLAAGVGVVVAVSSSGTSPTEPTPAGAPPGTPGASLPKRRRIVSGDRLLLVGDSLAVGLTAPLKQLATSNEVKFAATAKEGTTIAYWSGADLPTSDVALVSLGTNDMKLLDPMSERPKLDALLKRLTTLSKRVIWLLPPPMPFPDKGVLKMIDDASREAKTALVPPLDVDRGPDKIHPTGRGYAAWAGFIWNLIS